MVLTVYKYNGVWIRTPGGNLAGTASCCCETVPPGTCCCQLDGMDLTATIDAPDCSASVDGQVITLVSVNPEAEYCEIFQGAVFPGNCSSGPFTITLNLRCNNTLPDRGGGAFDYYEMEAVYTGVPCAYASTGWHRVQTGATCDPLSLVFKIPPPAWDGASPAGNCDCCTSLDNMTVTVTL